MHESFHDKETNVCPEAPSVENQCSRDQRLSPLCIVDSRCQHFNHQPVQSLDDPALPTGFEPLGRVWHLTTVQLLPPSSQRDFLLLAGCCVGIVTGATQLLVSLLGAQVEYAVTEAQNIEGCLETSVRTQGDDYFFL